MIQNVVRTMESVDYKNSTKEQVGILDTEVSYFTHCNQSDVPARTVSLRKLLTTDHFADKVAAVRAESDKAKRKAIKELMSAFTPSCTCSPRTEANVLQHSGLLAFDIDLKDNLHIENYHELRHQLSNIAHVAYCGLSVSGTGIWGLVPITQPERHKEHFKALKEDFASIGIELDSAPSSPVSLRIVSYDPEGYFNNDAVPYERLYESKKVQRVQRTTYADNDRIADLLDYIKTTGTDLTHTYEQWTAIAFAIASEYGEGGRDYFHILSSNHPEYDPAKVDKKYDNALKTGTGRVSIGTLYHLAKEAGYQTKKTSEIPTPRVPTKPKTYMQTINLGRLGHTVTNEINEHGYPAFWDN